MLITFMYSPGQRRGEERGGPSHIRTRPSSSRRNLRVSIPPKQQIQTLVECVYYLGMARLQLVMVLDEDGHQRRGCQVTSLLDGFYVDLSNDTFMHISV